MIKNNNVGNLYKVILKNIYTIIIKVNEKIANVFSNKNVSNIYVNSK